MTDSLLFEWCGWAGFILILISLVLLVRLLVKRSRWSILRMTIVALTGVAIVSLWLHYADSIIAGGPMMMGGNSDYGFPRNVKNGLEAGEFRFLSTNLCPGDCEREDC